MLTAKEAAMRSMYNNKFKREMAYIEKSIHCAMVEGLYAACHFPSSDYEEDLLTLITNELESLGYKVQYAPAKPLPPGCPVDQWDFSSTLCVSWEDN